MLAGVYMKDIENLLIELAVLLRAYAAPDKSYYYEVPPVLKDDEQGLVEFGYSYIDVTPINGDEAVDKIISAYQDLYVFDETPQKSRRFVSKHPGFIVLDSHHEEVMKCAKALNEAKKDFRTEITRSSDEAFEKWQKVHDRFNYLITMAAYRTIYVFDEPVHRINFNWASRPLHTAYTYKELTDKLEKSLLTVPITHTRESWKAVLEQDKKAIIDKDCLEYAVRRRIKLRPESSISMAAETGQQGYSASLPYILINQPEFHTHLKSFDASKATSRKLCDSNGWELINKRMNLYARRKE
jgi:DNA replication terminus site-binding protein